MNEKEVIIQNLTYKDLKYWAVDCEYVIPIIATLNGEKYVCSTDDISISNDTTFKLSSCDGHFAISDFIVLDNLIDANVGNMDMCLVSRDLLEDKDYWHFIADEASIYLSEDMLMKFFRYVNHKMDIKPRDKSSKAARSKTMDMNEIIKMQMMMKMMKSDKDFDISKMLIMQAMTSGGEVNLSEVMKAKMLSSLMEDGADNVPTEKLALIKMVESGSFNISDYLKTKVSLDMIENPDNFDESRLMLITMLDGSADINDIFKMKMLMKMLDSEDSEK